MIPVQHISLASCVRTYRCFAAAAAAAVLPRRHIAAMANAGGVLLLPALPPSLIAVLEGWGKDMCEAVVNTRDMCISKYNASRSGMSLHRWPLQPSLDKLPKLRVGTDCSGAEAPVWALRELGIRFEHCFGSESCPEARAFLKLNSWPSEMLFEDMCKRGGVPPHHIYVCGFPCTPFSSLHNRTAFFREAAAAPFRHALLTMKTAAPAIAIFENVLGLLRVKRQLTARLRRVPGYVFFVLTLDPRLFGQPMRRPRVYIVGVRRDCSAVPDTSSAQSMIRQLLAALGCGVSQPGRVAVDLLLPNTHVLVKARLLEQQNRFNKAKAVNFKAKQPNKCKWTTLHNTFSKNFSKKNLGVAKKELGPGAAMSGTGSHLTFPVPSADSMMLTSTRQRDAWELLRSKHTGSDLVADLSQSMGRQMISLTGILPTITPKSAVAVSRLSRTLLGEEKLMAMGFPVHKMYTPPSFPLAALHTLGGNAMHVRCVGAALVIGLCLVDAAKLHLHVPGTPRSSCGVSQVVYMAQHAGTTSRGRQVAASKAGWGRQACKARSWRRPSQEGQEAAI